MEFGERHGTSCVSLRRFHNLRCFNLAMLGKQVVRLILRPDSLVSRIFRATYYHDTSFFEAPNGMEEMKVRNLFGSVID
ncbi:Polynucleotidyl transferase, Ribonuclease H fold [Gossypium australe]|uniref:Polynucleotidyl transferase, Ribonuclease H fold n=1 Tax=Gossypium australe TaxID=47621 RepID=A0A5B6WXE2_9ROSI|nr:Polynucleotidyl transferase, Ribonuclease H fold [Gossypium australe]